jgi:Zn-dependent alcohol dehydrogenase
MISLLAAGVVSTDPLTSHQYPLSDVATAYTMLERREAIRPIVTM